MEISAINANSNINFQNNVKDTIKKESVEPNTAGYAEKAEAPANADLYKTMYGVKEQKSYEEQMAEVRAKYELDVDDKRREMEANKNKSEESEQKKEKSFEEQYLEFKHKYE